MPTWLSQQRRSKRYWSFLGEGEEVEAVCFGEFGWNGYAEPIPQPIQEEHRGKLLTWEAARPLMRSWQFSGGFGAPETYNTYIWTNRRVLFVHEYDGATHLDALPRHPIPTMPEHH